MSAYEDDAERYYGADWSEDQMDPDFPPERKQPMQCPDCGGAMWDNRQTKRNPKQPDFKCKNKQCDKAVWLKPKGENGGGSRQASGSGQTSAPVQRPLGRLYFESLKIAYSSLKEVMGDKATAESVVAAAATIFIGANQTGAPLFAPKKIKVVAPPPPPPEPEYADDPNPEYDDGLPF